MVSDSRAVKDMTVTNQAHSSILTDSLTVNTVDIVNML